MAPTWRTRDHAAPSVFRPEHLLREARRQRGLLVRDVPEVCALDPDGDLVRHLRRTGQARPSLGWACYHTELFEFDLPSGITAGVVGCTVGAPFAVLVAEQLFASGCRHLVSITSAGRIADLEEPPYLVLIDRALRDEGTSSHYLPAEAGQFVPAPNPALLDHVEAEVRAILELAGSHLGTGLYRGATWTTDAPYRETEAAIDAARAQGVLAVEMEAAALYAFATARGVPVTCFAHVTNTMGQQAGSEFEKGEADGTATAICLIEASAKAFYAMTDRARKGCSGEGEPIRRRMGLPDRRDERPSGAWGSALRVRLVVHRVARGQRGHRPSELAGRSGAAHGRPPLDLVVPCADRRDVVLGRVMEAAVPRVRRPAILDGADGGKRRIPLRRGACDRRDAAAHGGRGPAGVPGRTGTCGQFHSGRCSPAHGHARCALRARPLDRAVSAPSRVAVGVHLPGHRAGPVRPAFGRSQPWSGCSPATADLAVRASSSLSDLTRRGSFR